MKIRSKRGLALLMIATGLVVPRVIDWVENARHLDISRDIGALPWLILTIAGVVLLVWTFVRKSP